MQNASYCYGAPAADGKASWVTKVRALAAAHSTIFYGVF